MSKSIQGVLPILHTPFHEDNSIDEASFKREIDYVYSLGCSGVCTAMVSEVLKLTISERIYLNKLMSNMNEGRGITVASVGAESTKQALEIAIQAERDGCDALMAIPPLSSALPESALETYFSEIADAVKIPLIIQDASGYVGQAMSIEFQAKMLAKYNPDKILFKPEAAPIGPCVSDLRDATNGKAKIFEGSGGVLLVDSFRRGITGTMPGCDLLDAVCALWKALEAGDDEAIYRIYFPICAMIAIAMQPGLDGFLAIEKYILKKKGIFETDIRRGPNTWALDSETQAEVDRLLIQIEKALS